VVRIPSKTLDPERKKLKKEQLLEWVKMGTLLMTYQL
jgi:hypothetical protein